MSRPLRNCARHALIVGLFFWCVAAFVHPVHGAAWPEPRRLPITGLWETVIAEGVVAGSRLQMLRTVSSRTVQAVLEEVQGNWPADERVPQLNRQHAGWFIVSRWHGEEIETVQVRERTGGGAEAWLVRTTRRPHGSGSKDFADTLMPAAFKRLHALESTDPHAENVTLIGVAAESIDQAWSTLQAALSARQFSLQPVGNSATLPAGVRSALLANRTHEVAVTLDARRGPTTLVMHVREVRR